MPLTEYEKQLEEQIQQLTNQIRQERAVNKTLSEKLGKYNEYLILFIMGDIQSHHMEELDKTLDWTGYE